MKKGSMYIIEIIGVVLIILLFAIAFAYSFESKKADKTFNSGIISINDKTIKLPIKISELEKEIGNISFQSETYDGGESYKYNKNGEKSLLTKHATAEGTMGIDGIKYGVIITNFNNKDTSIEDCYMTGIHMNDSVVLFNKLRYSSSILEMKELLNTGILNPYITEKTNFIQYKKNYVIEISDYEEKDVLYYYDYENCKNNECHFD